VVVVVVVAEAAAQPVVAAEPAVDFGQVAALPVSPVVVA
jgi:hypothetical protein